jgi:dipeptidyl aminopeptidase/acylaminoacyl peptidase
MPVQRPVMSDILERRPPPYDERIKYGPDRLHFADLRFPEGSGPFPFLLMIHGGFWQSAYNLEHTGHLCSDLTGRGIVTCNLEYRRIGDAGGGWPGTFQDISLASYKIPEILNSDPRVDMTRALVMGHSAGGHLALWLVSRHKILKTSTLHEDRKSLFTTAVSLAGVSDLRTAWKQKLGHGIVTRLIGGSPDQHPDRYDAGSPIELLPNGSRQVLIHGSADDTVPVSQSEQFMQKAEQLDDDCQLVKLEGIGHFELIDPESNAWPIVVGEVSSLLGKSLQS